MKSEDYRSTSYEVWEVMAPGWERWRGQLEAALAPVRGWLIRGLAPQLGATVLELGAGTGDTGFAAAAIVGGQGRLISPGTNFDRLVEVKETYDPENVFRSNRNIRPRARVGKAGAA